MDKDPAFLFYTDDFIAGTYTMRDEQVGKYIRLLCLQHQKGRLSEKDMIKICKTYDEDIYEKFKKDGEMFFNERLDKEATKRKLYAESRRNNRTKKETYVPHMGNVNGNTNKVSIAIEINEEKKIAIFEDGSTQKLGKFQKLRLDNDSIKPSDILKGQIN